MNDAILKIEGLHTHYFSNEGVAKAVDGVSLTVRRGSTLCLVGESGCGKTTVGLSILNLVPYPGRIVGGRVFLDGSELTGMGNEALRRVRGREISMIFQDPVSGLNPVLPIGVQVEEIISSHLNTSKKESRQRALQVLRRSGLAEPERLMGMYPFHLSGGMCQRVMIAIATALNPKVVIADEPTASLDVTVQAAILDELNTLRRERGNVDNPDHPRPRRRRPDSGRRGGDVRRAGGGRRAGAGYLRPAAASLFLGASPESPPPRPAAEAAAAHKGRAAAV